MTFERKLDAKEIEHLGWLADDRGLTRREAERVLLEVERCYQVIATLERETERLQEVCQSYLDNFIEGKS